MSDADQPGPSNPSNSRRSRSVAQPKPLKLQGDLKTNWSKFKQTWDAYEIITGLDQEPDKTRIAHFIVTVGQDALDIHNGLPFKKDEDKVFKKILDYWDAYCIGKTNVTYERFKFFKCTQGHDETIDAYYVRVRKLSSSCALGKLQEELIRDVIVCGVSSQTVQEQLLQDGDLTLDKCLDVCRAAEASKSHVKLMSKETNENVHFVNKKSKPLKEILCKFCGTSHMPRKLSCPAWGKECKKCHKPNHVAEKCNNRSTFKFKNRRSKQSHHGRKKAYQVESDSDCTDSVSEDDDVLTLQLVSDRNEHDVHNVKHVNEIHERNAYKPKIMAIMKVKGNPYPITMQIDSGCTCNVLPDSCLPAGAVLSKTKARLQTYDKNKLPVLGTTQLELTNPKNERKYIVTFQVVHIKGNKQKPLIGSSTAQQMGLISVNEENIVFPESYMYNVHEVKHTGESPTSQDGTHTGVSKDVIFQKFTDIFEGVGRMPGVVHLQVDKEVPPVVMPPRRVPIAIKCKLKEELGRLQSLDIITKVEGPTDWVSSLVTVVKPSGKLRVCIDPQQLNKALKREQYPLPIIEDVLPQLSKVKVFSKADCKEGFLQCELDEESSKLTTFQTPWGRYRYKRLPFGLAPSPELFQAKLDQCLEGLEGIHTIADDVLITGQGDTLEEAYRDHDDNMHKFLQRCRERNVTLNREKFEFKVDNIKFIGHQLTRNGLKPDPSKVEAIRKMEAPTDVAGVQRFVGMVKYLAKFLPDLSEISEPLRRLTHKNVVWLWTHEHTKSFEAIKDRVITAPLLRYFDPQLDTEGQGDASEKGLGFALLQNGQPITYASRALTPAETRYSQIEKELLAQVFGLERNHQYVYGRKIRLWTDHKPLISINNKPLASCPKRLQCLLLRLKQYDVQLLYKPGKEMFLADTLSRAYLQDTTHTTPTEAEAESVNMIDYVPMSKQTYEAVKNAVAEDPSLPAVQHYIRNGWPDDKNNVDPLAHPYFHVRDELSEQDGVFFRGERVVIPKNARQLIRKRLHNSHSGLQSTLRRAREHVYWPNMSSDLKDYIAKCDMCNTYQAAQTKEPLINHDIPDFPWQKVGVDIFTLDSKDYLCSVDYYSDYFEVDPLSHSKAAPAIIKRLKRHMSSHGIPATVFSDNGPPFNSSDFSDFAEEYGFQHETSSPRYPQSNGKVESAVKIAKSVIKKATRDGQDAHLALLSWRNTPTEGMNSSPSQRFFSRRTRTQLPTAITKLTPEIQVDVKTRKQVKQQKQKKLYDRHAKELDELNIHQTVRIKPDKNTDRWIKAKVIKKVNIRSYLVKTEQGREYRRNRRDIKHSTEAYFDDQTCIKHAPIISPVQQTDQQRMHTGEKTSTAQGKTQNAQKSTNDNSENQNVRRSVRKKVKPQYLQDYYTK